MPAQVHKTLPPSRADTTVYVSPQPFHLHSPIRSAPLKPDQADVIYFTAYPAFVRFERFDAETISAHHYFYVLSLEFDRLFRVFNDRFIIFNNGILIPICLYDGGTIQYVRL